ncbi:flagellar hook-length control protein FliK [Xanthomonas albilineans]|uniref:flagellar hook-length control protein FliK n=1 Tax=Xanthomonas albilineans TaxID=29447 RepID=UPI0006991558|nr:flagellar hook-length control protein FliK [Xanthomonas albilineans]
MNNALSALGGSGRSSQLGNNGTETQSNDYSGDKDFDKLLGGDGPRDASTPTTQPSTPQTTEPSKKAQPSASNQDDAGKRPVASGDSPNDPARSAQTGGNVAQAGGNVAQAGDKVAQESDKSSADAKVPTKDKAAAKQGDQNKDDSAWPPTGLAGIGLGLLPAIGAAVLPAANNAPLGAATGLAIGIAGTATKEIGDLLGGDTLSPGVSQGVGASATTTTTASGTDTTTTSATSATANAGVNAANSFGTMLAQVASNAKTTGSETAAPVATLAAITAAIDDKHTDSSDATHADSTPINLLASTGIQTAARAMDAATPFTGSPTPTPNLHSTHFDEELGARISWLADQTIGHAHIKLNPAELGPIEVRLHLAGDQVNASFTSAQANVRQAVENSLPRLREMLGQHGFQLGQADVGHQPQQQQAGTPNMPQQYANGSGEVAEERISNVEIPTMMLRQRGLLDAYA